MYRCQSQLIFSRATSVKRKQQGNIFCFLICLGYQLRRKTVGGVGEAYLVGATNLFQSQSNVNSLEQMKHVAVVTYV